MPVAKQVSPKVHVLFVVDNSGSTQPYQTKLAAGFKEWGQKFLDNPTLDVSVAAVTTDTYLAGTTTSDTSDYGPMSGACYSRLLPGIHDGPRPAVADGLGTSAFTSGTCNLTAAATAKIKAKGDRSLSPILSTLPADGSIPGTAYLTSLITSFEQNAMPGTGGNGSERGFQSLHQFLKDNEERTACSAAVVTDPSCFFPHYDLGSSVVPPINVVTFISDEHDQSDTNFGTGTVINHLESSYSKSTDAQLLTSSLTLAQAAKTRFDGFFKSLHEATNPDPNYSVIAIVNSVCNTTNSACGLQKGTNTRPANEAWGIEYATLVDAYAGNVATDGRLAQPMDTVNSMAQYSKSYDVEATDYNAVFDYIGTRTVNSTVTVMVNTFTTARDITTPNAVTAVVVLGDGTMIPVPQGTITVTLPRMVSISAAELQDLVPATDTKTTVKITYP